MNRIFINARFLTQPMSGVQNFAWNLCLSLKKAVPGVCFLTCRDVLHPEKARELDAIPVGRLQGHAWEQIELPGYLKKNGSPLLLNFCNTAPLNYKNQFNTIHDLAFEQKAKWFGNQFRYYYRWLIPRVAKNCLKLFTVSEFSASEISTHYHIPREKIKVTYNTVSAEMESLIAISGNTLPAEKYFLTVGSLDPRKNTAMVIDAFLSLGLPGVKLKISGRKNPLFNDPLPGLATMNHPQIEWLDATDNVQLVSLYRNAAALINLSFYEGFGLTNLEAMTCGCPVIGSRIPVFNEVCADAALYVDPVVKSEIAAAMLQVLENKNTADEMKVKGRKRAALFSREASLSVLLAELKTAGY